MQNLLQHFYPILYVYMGIMGDVLICHGYHYLDRSLLLYFV